MPLPVELLRFFDRATQSGPPTTPETAGAAEIARTAGGGETGELAEVTTAGAERIGPEREVPSLAERDVPGLPDGEHVGIPPAPRAADDTAR
jgi:hypothetical protein